MAEGNRFWFNLTGIRIIDRQKFFRNTFSAVCNIVDQRTDDRKVDQKFIDPAILVGGLPAFQEGIRIDHNDPVKKFRVIVTGGYHKRRGTSADYHIGSMSNHRFDKVREKLNIEKICVSQIWFLRATAAKQINGVNGM